MTLKFDYNGTTIIDWQPAANQWWITGFNPNYCNKSIQKTQLKATFTVAFTNSSYYNAFKTRIEKDKRQGWTFNNNTTPIFVL